VPIAAPREPLSRGKPYAPTKASQEAHHLAYRATRSDSPHILPPARRRRFHQLQSASTAQSAPTSPTAHCLRDQPFARGQPPTHSARHHFVVSAGAARRLDRKLANLNQEIEKVLLRLETSIGEGLSCGAR